MKKVFLKTFFLLIAMIVIIPIVLNFEAEAGTGSKEYHTYSNIWLLETNKEKSSGGNLRLLIKTYIKNDTGEYVASPYIQDTTITYSSQPGNSTLTLESGYSLNRMELWKNSTKQIDTGSSSNRNAINIQLESGTTKVLKIYVDERYNDLGYDNSNTSGGDVNLNKTAAPVSGKSNEFDLEFSVLGEAITRGKNADIILVLDKSGSMRENISSSKSKAAVLEEAADRFIDAVLSSQQSGDNRVAVVAYSDEAQIRQTFTSNKTTAKNSYNNFYNLSDGGTNSESGFIKARELFGTSFRMGAEKYVIYMTDGEPTQYYDINGEVVGLGNEFDVNAKNAAIEEANLLKNYGGSGIKIYTIGFAPSNTSDMQALLNPSTNSYQEGYYHAKTADDLTNIYSIIADTIIDSIAKNATVTDTLPDSFEFIKDSLPENVTVSEDGVMTWDLGSITTSESSKIVKIRYTGENYGVKFANEGAEISYKHVLTPNVLTEEDFVNPLVVITPNVAEYVYYTNKGENIIITPPNMSIVNEAGDDYTISDLKIKVDDPPQKPNSKATHNAEHTEITYVPQSQGYTEDSFSYIVYFTVSSDSDPKDLFSGTSKTFERNVNVIINPHPDVNLTINYFEVLNGENRPLSVNGATSVVKQLPRDGFIDEFAPVITGYNLIDISYDGIINPVLAGKRLTGQAGKNNIEINYYYNRDSSLVFDNILYNNSMYKNDALQPLGDNADYYDAVAGINYRFGVKFQTGQNVDNLDIVFTGAGSFTLTNFNLYDEDNNLVHGPVNDYNLIKPFIGANSIYTVTYNVKSDSPGLSMNVQVNNANLESPDVPSQITINSIGTLELE